VDAYPARGQFRDRAEERRTNLGEFLARPLGMILRVAAEISADAARVGAFLAGEDAMRKLGAQFRAVRFVKRQGSGLE